MAKQVQGHSVAAGRAAQGIGPEPAVARSAMDEEQRRMQRGLPA